METQDNLQFAALVKDQYLPPPLQDNYLSLFDIQVKTAKQLLEGSEQQKIQLIKKRIKKFFDYGEDLNQATSSKYRMYPPFQTEEVDIKKNLEINPSIIIIYGKQLKQIPLKSVETMFPKHISCQRIDDCNMIITYASQKEGVLKVYENVLNRSQSACDNLFYPVNIEWFQLKPYYEGNQQKRLYVRFGTNKEDTLRTNGIYFRKILAKAREMFEKKKIQAEQNQKEFQAKLLERQIRHGKRKVIYRMFDRKRDRNFNKYHRNEHTKRQRNAQYYMGMRNKSSKNQSSTQSFSIENYHYAKNADSLNETVFQEQPYNFPPMMSSNFKHVVSKQTYFQDLNFSVIKPSGMEIQMEIQTDQYEGLNKFTPYHKFNFQRHKHNKVTNQPIHFQTKQKQKQRSFSCYDKGYRNQQRHTSVQKHPFHKNQVCSNEKMIPSRQKLIQQYRNNANNKNLDDYNYANTFQKERQRIEQQAKGNMDKFIQL